MSKYTVIVTDHYHREHTPVSRPRPLMYVVELPPGIHRLRPELHEARVLHAVALERQKDVGGELEDIEKDLVVEFAFRGDRRAILDWRG
jgi:hypothetical protein